MNIKELNTVKKDGKPISIIANVVERIRIEIFIGSKATC